MQANGAHALVFLVNIVFTLYIAALFLRIILLRLRADYYNPLVHFIARITDPPLRPFRKIIPAFGGWDIAAMVLAIVCAFVCGFLVLHLSGLGTPWLFIASYTGRKLLAVLVNLYIFSILIQALLSWLGPRQYSPLAVILWRVNEPLLRPIRRIIPPLGGTFDLSPLVVIVLLEALSIFLGLPMYL